LCGATVTIDKASVNVNSQAAFLAVLKTHQTQVKTMKDNLPPGSIGITVRGIVAAMEQAIVQNSTAPFNSIENGTDLDTYCGVDGNGTPLPSDFAAGRGTQFCNGFVFIYDGVTQATTPAGALNALIAGKGQVDRLAGEVSSLPGSIQAEASSAVSAAESAIAQNSTASVLSLQGPATNVALYCGQNT
jgi:hypothetical protein